MAITAILLDTSAYAAFKKGKRDVLTFIQEADRIYFNPIVMGELRAGFRNGSKEKQNLAELHQFLESPRVFFKPIGEHTAEHYARLWYDLKQKGRPIPTNDLWIAASACEHQVSLVTCDRHFEVISSLAINLCGS